MPGTDLSSNLNQASHPIRGRSIWRILVAPALVAAFAVAAPTTASAQDIGPGKSKPAKKAPAKKAPAKKAPAKKAPATPAKKAPATPAKKAPATPAKKAPATPAKKAPATPAKKAPAAKTADTKKSLDGAMPSAKAAAKTPAAGTDASEAPAIKSLSQGFEKILAPHGTWVDDETYGKLWVPDAKEVGKNFAPYRTGGRWAATDDGSWSWVSDYKWGNVPFHYGRWLWTKEKQWAWSPGETYAPAWVIWRVGDAGYDFVGWAPMAPEPKPVKAKPAAAAKEGAKKATPKMKLQPAKAGGEKVSEKAAKKAAPTTKVLPFYFVANKHLFLQGVEKYVLTDRKLGHAVQKHSEIYEGNRIEGRKGFFKPATPTFSEIRVPAFAIPRSRLSALAEEVAPLTLDAVRGLVSAAAPTPAEKAAAPAEKAAAEPAPEKAAPAEEAKSAKRSFATPPAAEKQDGKTRYRCWWTNSRPRIWRCGY